MSKECRKCQRVLPLSGYYKHSGMKDGHLNICKECKRSDVSSYRAENIDRIRSYDRNRPNAQERKDRFSKYHKKMMKESPEYAARSASYEEKWHNANREKRAAHTILNNAVRDGRVSKPSSCSICGSSGIIHGHHTCYTRPIDVIWCCPQCHSNIHKQERKTQREQP